MPAFALVARSFQIVRVQIYNMSIGPAMLYCNNYFLFYSLPVHHYSIYSFSLPVDDRSVVLVSDTIFIAM
jgi:hypothetical protein